MTKFIFAILLLLISASFALSIQKPDEWIKYSSPERSYEVDKRVYVLQMIFPKPLESEAVNAKAAKYFDSFQVVKN
jgi:hypothetical protein